MEIKFVRKLFIAALLTPFIFTTSCEKIFPIVDCNECLDYEPYQATVTVKTTSMWAPIAVNVYEGNDTSGERIKTFYNYANESTVVLALNKTYTFEAIYIDAGKTYRAINSVKPSVKYTDSECDEECWYIYNNKVDLRLKYL